MGTIDLVHRVVAEIIYAQEVPTREELEKRLFWC
jgi:hypothetical protein